MIYTKSKSNKGVQYQASKAYKKNEYDKYIIRVNVDFKKYFFRNEK